MPEFPTIESLARERAGHTASLFLSWKQALDALCFLPPGLLAKIARCSPDPVTARQVGVYLSRDPQPIEKLEQFLAEVEESGEPLQEWLAGFRVLVNHLSETPHRPGFTEVMGYLHCCEALLESGARYATFPMTVEAMLETFGFEGRPQA